MRTITEVLWGTQRTSRAELAVVASGLSTWLSGCTQYTHSSYMFSNIRSTIFSLPTGRVEFVSLPLPIWLVHHIRVQHFLLFVPLRQLWFGGSGIWFHLLISFTTEKTLLWGSNAQQCNFLGTAEPDQEQVVVGKSDKYWKQYNKQKN